MESDEFDDMVARSILVRGLPKHRDGNEIMELETAIYGLFEAYFPEAVNIGMLMLYYVVYVNWFLIALLLLPE
jgi:hypothetical protein